MAVTDIHRLRRAELIALVQRREAALAIGRKKGSAMQALAAALRRSAIDRAVADLVRNSETGNWRTDACVRFVFDRQAQIGLRRRYAFATLDRLARSALRKYRPRGSARPVPKS